MRMLQFASEIDFFSSKFMDNEIDRNPFRSQNAFMIVDLVLGRVKLG